MLGIRSESTPGRERFAWAAVAAVFGVVLLAVRQTRFDGSLPWFAYVIAATLSAVIGYYASTWRREG